MNKLLGTQIDALDRAAGDSPATDGQDGCAGGDGLLALCLVLLSAVWLAIGTAFGVWLS